MAQKKTSSRTPKSSTTHTPKAAKAPKPSKSAFVRSLPFDLPARNVVAKGKEAGISLTEKYVYAVRAAARLQKGGSTAKKGAAASAKAAPAKKSGAAEKQVRHAEELLRAAATELGLSRAIDLLLAERKRVLHVLGDLGRESSCRRRASDRAP